MPKQQTGKNKAKISENLWKSNWGYQMKARMERKCWQKMVGIMTKMDYINSSK